MMMDADVSCLNDVKKRFWGEYYVYMHTFPDDRVYVGQTGKPVKERWGLDGNGYRGNKRMYEEIKRVGWDNIRHEVVATVYGRKNALLLERELMERYAATDNEKGFNTVKTVGFEDESTIVHFCDFYMSMGDFGLRNLGELDEGRYVIDQPKLHMKLMNAITDMCFFMEKNELYDRIIQMTGVKGYVKRNTFFGDKFINDCWSRGMFVDVKKIEDDIYDVALDGFAEIGRAPLW